MHLAEQGKSVLYLTMLVQFPFVHLRSLVSACSPASLLMLQIKGVLLVYAALSGRASRTAAIDRFHVATSCRSNHQLKH